MTARPADDAAAALAVRDPTETRRQKAQLAANARWRNREPAEPDGGLDGPDRDRDIGASSYIMWCAKHPCTCRAIERTTAECIKDGIERQGLTSDAIRDLFSHCFRMSICDDHSGIYKADFAMLQSRLLTEETHA